MGPLRDGYALMLIRDKTTRRNQHVYDIRVHICHMNDEALTIATTHFTHLLWIVEFMVRGHA